MSATTVHGHEWYSNNVSRGDEKESAGVSVIGRVRSWVVAFFRTDNDWYGLVMRLSLGVVFFPHGAQKVLGWFGGHGLSGTLGFFTSMGMPLALAVLVVAGEFLGSLGLITGFLTRLCGFGITCIMTGAIFMVHLNNGFFMNWMGAVVDGKAAGEGFEFHLLAIGLALALMFKGGGKYSADGLIAEKIAKK